MKQKGEKTNEKRESLLNRQVYTHTHTHKVIKKIERNKNKASPMI